MFVPSVKLVPGWSVTIAPRLIGVPVAAAPGLVPHVEVLAVTGALELELADEAAAGLDVAPVAWLLELELLLHPARTTLIAVTTMTAPGRSERRREFLFMCSASSLTTSETFPELAVRSCGERPAVSRAGRTTHHFLR